VVVQVLHLFFKSNRQTDIVSVHSCDPFPAGKIHPAIQGKHEPLVLLVFQGYDAGVIETIDDLLRMIGGSIIDNDEFKVGVTLIQDALDGFAKVFGCIKNGHDHTDRGT
jgi:hypothetical protein